jgi:hypothetical protein
VAHAFLTSLYEPTNNANYVNVALLCYFPLKPYTLAGLEVILKQEKLDENPVKSATLTGKHSVSIGCGEQSMVWPFGQTPFYCVFSEKSPYKAENVQFKTKKTCHCSQNCVPLFHMSVPSVLAQVVCLS